MRKMEKWIKGEIVLWLGRLVYWEENGEKRANELDLDLSKRKEVLTFHAEMDTFGHWIVKVVHLGEKFYAIFDWMPAPGYSWDETKIYELETWEPFSSNE